MIRKQVCDKTVILACVFCLILVKIYMSYNSYIKKNNDSSAITSNNEQKRVLRIRNGLTPLFPSTQQQKSITEASDEFLFLCKQKCGKYSRCFLGKCFCLPGWAGTACLERVVTPEVEKEVCPTFQILEEVTNSELIPYPNFETKCHVKGQFHTSSDCSVLCYWQEDAGIVQVGKEIWKKVSDIEFNIWNARQRFEPEDRDAEHAEGFHNFSAVPLRIGKLLEIGAGPYTQTKNLLKNRPDATVERIYLAEPNIFRYLKLSNCAYQNGTLRGHSVNLLSLPVEELLAIEYFDTIIEVNVIEHVYNAFDFLIAVYRALKPGGTLIFHERYFHDLVEGDATPLGPMLLHPMRLKRSVYIHFFRLFDPLYIDMLHTAAAIERNFGEHGYYFIGRKRDSPLEETEVDMEEFGKMFADVQCPLQREQTENP